MNLLRSSRITLAKTAVLGLCVCACAVLPAQSQPPNLGDLKTRLGVYVQSGAYERQLDYVGAQARTYLDTHLAGVAKPAIVLDIDETSLSNWREMKANDYGYIAQGPCDRLPSGPCGALAWDTSAKAAAIGPTLDLFNDAKARRVAVFFITGRDESERNATERNLHLQGFADWTKLIMRPHGSKTKSAADFKAPERGKIEAAGFTIIVNLGDQPSDLRGEHAQKGFLLPDPFYRIP